MTVYFRLSCCWKAVDGSFIVPCGDDCCIIRATIDTNLTDVDGYLVTDIQQLTNPNECQVCNDPDCVDVCTWIIGSQGIQIGDECLRISNNEAIESNSNSKRTSISYVNPNPTDGSVAIYLRSNIEGNIKVAIYDNLGNELISKTIIKKSEEVNWNIDFSKRVNGVYYYKIFSNQNEISSGKFILSK